MEGKNTTTIAKDIKVATIAFVDYLYNEGVVAYDDRHLCLYANGTKTIDYVDVCRNIIHDKCDPLSPTSLEMVTNLTYGLDEHGCDVVKASIDEAIKEFVKKGNCEMLVVVAKAMEKMTD